MDKLGHKSIYENSVRVMPSFMIGPGSPVLVPSTSPFNYGLPSGTSGKESSCQCKRLRDVGSIPGSGGRDPLEDGKATHSSVLAWNIGIHRQRSLAGYRT